MLRHRSHDRISSLKSTWFYFEINREKAERTLPPPQIERWTRCRCVAAKWQTSHNNKFNINDERKIKTVNLPFSHSCIVVRFAARWWTWSEVAAPVAHHGIISIRCHSLWWRFRCFQIVWRRFSSFFCNQPKNKIFHAPRQALSAYATSVYREQ